MNKTFLTLLGVFFLAIGVVATRADDKPGQAGRDQYGMSMADMMKDCKTAGDQCTKHIDQASQAKGPEMGKHLDMAKQDMSDCMALMHMMEPMHKGDKMMQQCMDHAKQCNIYLYLAGRAHEAGKHDEATKHLGEAKQHMTQCMDMLKMMDEGGAKQPAK